MARDQVLDQLKVCTADRQVFDIVAKNKAKLTVDHVCCAVQLLWQFQKVPAELLSSEPSTRSHPEFLTLRVLAENKIAQMDDLVLVDMLYAFHRLKVKDYDSLVQQLVSEAWLRLERLPLPSLSKFAVCLFDQHLQHSPLMGRIASIMDQRLSSIDDLRVLTALMICVSSVASPRLQVAIIGRAYDLMATADPLNYNNPRRILQFLRFTKHNHRPLLERCNGVFLRNLHRMDTENICIILGLCQSLQVNDCDLKLAAKQRLTDLIDTCTGPTSFTNLFLSLAPMAGPEVRQRLENTAQLLADELSAYQAMSVAEVLQEIQSKNFNLLNKIASVIQRNIDCYKPVEVSRITQAFRLSQYQNTKLYATLREILMKFLQSSFIPQEVNMLVRVLSLLPSPQFNDGVVSRIHAVVSQNNLNELNTFAVVVAKWLKNDRSYHHNVPGKCALLLQSLTHIGHERLRTASRLDALLSELRYVSSEWFEEMLLEETVATLQRMTAQLNATNVSAVATFLARMNHLCPPLMDQIAAVAVEQMDKIDYRETHDILSPFSVTNYDVGADELYDACIKHFTPHITSFEPHLLVLLAHSLALANRFPEELAREIFSIDFLGKLDSQLDTLSESLNLRTRQRLMEFNRAVCLECPEFQVPWFHDCYSQHLQRKRNLTSPVKQQIHKMLGEVLGGINCVQVAVTTPYFYTVDFECKLDRQLRPLSYSKPKTLQMLDRGSVDWDVSSHDAVEDELPPGVQRVAIEFVDSKSFCKNSHQMRGEFLMRKRHLEILGYRVVQIPHFEWNSMELSTPDAWRDYLKQKIFE